ncbi:MAG: MFS transporter [Chloroflexi bacterium]|nr:MFS transporter [Chloroflexota bacterium]
MVHSSEKSKEYQFEMRRVNNWLPLGLMYAAFYMSRYNITVTNPALRDAFNWNKEQFGWIISASLIVYGLSVLFNGPLADRIGGKKAILIGGFGALLLNLLFAAGQIFKIFNWEKSPWLANALGVVNWLTGLFTGIVNGIAGLFCSLFHLTYNPWVLQAINWYDVPWLPLLTYFIVIWCINMYFQSYGALSVVKVNAAWFHISERGIFAGLFGAMIQFGRILAIPVGGVILAASSWQWVHIIPTIVLAAMLIYVIMVVKDTPEELGYARQDDVLVAETDAEEKPSYSTILKIIWQNPTLWIIAGAMLCTGVVRHTIEQWAPSYFMDVHHVASDSMVFLVAFAGQVMIGIFGSFVMGNISDRYFQSRRGPVTAIAYFFMAVLLLVFGLAKPGPWTAAIILMILYFFLNGCHGLLAGTASMDFGGRKAAATAAGLLDGIQYLAGGIVTGSLMGWVLDKYSWDAWAWTIIPFALIGGILMATRWNALPKKKGGAVEEFVLCPDCGVQSQADKVNCDSCGVDMGAFKAIALKSKEAFNTGIFSLLMVLFPLVIVISKMLGMLKDIGLWQSQGFVNVLMSFLDNKVIAVMIMAFLGILIGILAVNRANGAKKLIDEKNIGKQYLELYGPAMKMGVFTIIASIIATAYGAFILFTSL